MPTIKSLSVGNGDMFYILHGGDSFTMIDCNLTAENSDDIIAELKDVSKTKGVRRFICTHPDEDHFKGIEKLDAQLPIANFYCVKNKAQKDELTDSFLHYCALRDGGKAFYLEKGVKRKWLNEGGAERGSSGIQILWPDTSNENFKDALRKCDAGESFNNVSCVLRYSVNGGASFMWLGDLETEFMESIVDDIELTKTTVVFASHHGRASGKIPDSWLEKIDPQIIVIGQAPSRHLDYYTGYNIITQNRAGHITMDCVGGMLDIYVTGENYERDYLGDLGKNRFPGYIGSLEVETEYTL
ncbi:ComEC/Rec2 family competence protein [Pseudomonas aeruginosa]